MNIKTNHQWRNFLYWHELPEKAKKDLDYADQDGSFFKYKGNYYSLEDFVKTTHIIGWHGYVADSYFSGVLIRLSNDGEQYQVGTYFS
jgi:hypothetical protein